MLTRREVLMAVSACVAVACRSGQQSTAAPQPPAADLATVTLAVTGMT